MSAELIEHLSRLPELVGRGTVAAQVPRVKKDRRGDLGTLPSLPHGGCLPNVTTHEKWCLAPFGLTVLIRALETCIIGVLRAKHRNGLSGF